MKRRRLLTAAGLSLLALSIPATAWAAEGAGGTNPYAPLAPLLVVFPLIGLVINLFAGRYFGNPWAGILASGAAGLSFVIAVLQAVGLAASGYAAVTVPVADWIHIGDLNVAWAFQVDTLSATMMLVVTGVGTLIHVYAIGYMNDDVRHNGDPGRFARFFVYLNLFLVAMLILIGGDSYLTLFVGWEGVGLCSYLLIGFWFEKGERGVGNARAARKAFVVNRIGDWAMLMAIFLIFWMVGSLTFNTVFERLAAIRVSVAGQIMLTLTAVLLLIGATGKSAQVPLYVWLPDAMAGPTPVSALIHAATMVTAGIYMIVRSSALFGLSVDAMNLVAWIGAITALWAGLIAVGQFDIKRVLAYSTISQLGFMVAAVGLGGYVAGMFHLVTHAFFKALLFLSSGSVIQAVERGHEAHAAAAHAVGGGHGESHGAADHTGAAAHEGEAHHDAHHGPDPQDMRNMGGLWSRLPVTRWVYLIGALALAGIVPFAGFWSKDEILLDAFKHNRTIYFVLTVAAGFTAFYMGRQILMVFFGRPRSDSARYATESPRVVTYPLIVLAFLSIVGGALNLPTIAGFTPPGAHLMSEWLGHTLGGHAAEAEHGAEAASPPEAGHGAEAEAGAAAGTLDFGVAGTSTVVAVGAIALAYFLYRGRPQRAEDEDPLHEMAGPLFNLLTRKLYVDELYEILILRPYDWLARFAADVLDWRFWHDWFHDTLLAGVFNAVSRVLAVGVDLGGIDGLANGLADWTRGLAGWFRRLQAGYARGYALVIFAGVIAVLGYFLIAR